MVSKDQSLTFMDPGLCCSDSVTFALIIVLTIFKEDIGLRFLGDAIDFALLLQFAIVALLSIANQQSPFTSPTCSLKLAPPLISLAANMLLGAWHFSHACLPHAYDRPSAPGFAAVACLATGEVEEQDRVSSLSRRNGLHGLFEITSNVDFILVNGVPPLNCFFFFFFPHPTGRGC